MISGRHSLVLILAATVGLAALQGRATVAYALSVPAERPIAQPDSVFIEPLGDVPLMSGMEVDVASALIFDKPEGRFVEIAGSIQGVNAETVYDYYDQALGQLGWNKKRVVEWTGEPAKDQAGQQGGQYVRASETLEILYIQDPSNQGGGAMVRFVLSPEKK